MNLNDHLGDIIMALRSMAIQHPESLQASQDCIDILKAFEAGKQAPVDHRHPMRRPIVHHRDKNGFEI